jgi:hypothetical protein
MSRPEPDDEDAPITLKEACQWVFRDAITPYTLRAEAGRGRIAISRIGKRDFTTLREARELFNRCHAAQQGHGSISIQDEINGPSETVSVSSAQDALQATLRELKNSSRSTSPGSTSPSRDRTH